MAPRATQTGISATPTTPTVRGISNSTRPSSFFTRIRRTLPSRTSSLMRSTRFSPRTSCCSVWAPGSVTRPPQVVRGCRLRRRPGPQAPVWGRGGVVFCPGRPQGSATDSHRISAGNTFDHRYSATEFVDTARLDTREMQVLYRDANGLHVMDISSYDQYTLDEEITGDAAAWMEPGMNFQAEWLEGRPIAISLPAVIELDVVETTPAMRGSTKTASTKPARLSNGVTVQVPEFIAEGDRLRVDPRSGQYLERAK